MSITALQGDAGQLPQQVQELVDRQAIADLIYRLGLWLDEKRFDEARSIFTEDVTVDTAGGSAGGIELVADQARRNHVVRTHHVITNVLVEVEGDQATARANLIATFVQDAGEPESQFMIGERYHFQVVRMPQGWRLSRVQVGPAWSRGSRPGAAARPS